MFELIILNEASRGRGRSAKMFGELIFSTVFRVELVGLPGMRQTRELRKSTAPVQDINVQGEEPAVQPLE